MKSNFAVLATYFIPSTAKDYREPLAHLNTSSNNDGNSKVAHNALLQSYTMLISIEEIIKTAVLVYLKHWRRLLPYMALTFLPTLVLAAMGLIGVYLNAYVPATYLPTVILILAVFAASLVFGFWVSLAMVLKIKALLTNTAEPSVRETMRDSSAFLGTAILISVITVIIVTLGAFLFIVPGIIFFGWYFFAVYAIAIDGIRGLRSLTASKELVVGRWFAIMLRILVPTLVFVAVVVGATWVITLPTTFLLGAVAEEIVNNLLVAAVNAVLTPLSVIGIVALYLSAKYSLTHSETPTLQG